MKAEIERLLWVLDHSPFEMDVKIKFINGTNNIVTSWLGHGGEHLRRFTRRAVTKTLQYEVSYLTSVVMSHAYGHERVASVDAWGTKYIIEYEWLDLPSTFYHGFTNKRSMNKWLSQHKDWLAWVQIAP